MNRKLYTLKHPVLYGQNCRIVEENGIISIKKKYQDVETHLREYEVFASQYIVTIFILFIYKRMKILKS